MLVMFYGGGKAASTMQNGGKQASQWHPRSEQGSDRSAAVLLDPHPLWLNAVEQVIQGLGMGVVASA
ncbi:MAG TPA: hypothetical protein VFV62_05350, partial [Gaiellaceae bacterium]|nr:hypothetical protein [Gaiellaceae bacterium]